MKLLRICILFLALTACKKSSTVKVEILLPTITTVDVSSVTTSGANSGGNITSDGGATITARGVVWGTSSNPTIDLQTKTIDGQGIGSFQSVITGLTLGTKYFIRAYATNSKGTSYGNEVTFTTTEFNTVVGANGKIWMDRNLGATRVATSSNDASSFGDLYQWGRGKDGHQLRTSPTTTILSATDNPGNANFIYASRNWRSTENKNLWSGVSGTNNPCPVGFRLPTEAEWEAERVSWSSNNATGAFSSPLKLPAAGNRNNDNAVIGEIGTVGYYWTSSAALEKDQVKSIRFYSNAAAITLSYPADGGSIRCIKN
jgi:Fibrobacter succinogenes major domain (Fib_succ_major)